MSKSRITVWAAILVALPMLIGAENAAAKPPASSKAQEQKAKPNFTDHPAARVHPAKKSQEAATKEGQAKDEKPDDWQSGCKDKGGSVAPEGKAEGTQGPKVRVLSAIAKAEPVWHGEMIECFWEIKNEGDRPLTIRASGG